MSSEHHFSPQTWLAIALVSFLLAVGSGGFLYTKLDEDQKEILFTPYDAVARFARETIRLSFKTDVYGASVFVAPPGILDPSATFTWVDKYTDFVPRFEDIAPDPIAPPRLLDPAWNPEFSGAQE